MIMRNVSIFYLNIHHLFLHVYILNNVHNHPQRNYTYTMIYILLHLSSKYSYVLASYCFSNKSFQIVLISTLRMTQ